MKRKPYILEYEILDVIEFRKCQMDIEELVDKGEKVPARLLKNFFSLQKCLTDEKIFVIGSAIGEILDQVSERYSGTDYDFTFTTKMRPVGDPSSLPKTVNVEFTYLNMVSFVCQTYYDAKEDGESNTRSKDQVIRLLYMDMCGYRNDFTPKLQKQITLYKIQVLSAFVTQCLSYTLAEIPPKTNKELFQASHSFGFAGLSLSFI